MINQAKSILKETFGFDTFRPLQLEIVENVLQKKDTLVIMPTGGGKSLCYQIPALIFKGLTVVISPLISLMKDQVEQLSQLGIKAIVLNSSLSPEEYDHNVELVRKNGVKLLYLAPETLLKENIVSLLSSIRIDCLTIDEAHCISEWGHDFRPEYRKIVNVRKKFPDAVCLALTATATPRVQKDITENLDFDASNEFIASFDRKNLFLQIVPKSDPLSQTLNFLKKFPDQSGIIYCFSRKQVDELAAILEHEGFSVKPYHAGLTSEDRALNQELFIKDDVQIIVATIAFGMGINKPNIRFIVHYDLPKNIESYYQEIGRSGRDGLKAHCLLLFGYGDIQKIKYFMDQKEEQERRVAQIHLNALVSFAETELCRRIPLLNYFGEKYNSSTCDMCDNCLAEEKELVDITIPAQMFFSCIIRTGNMFGANHIIDVLRGSQAQKILDFKHHQLSTYGIGKDYTKKQWSHMSRQFIQKGFMFQDAQYGSLKLTEKAYEVLKGSDKVLGVLQEEVVDYSKDRQLELEYDRDLFELLRRKRKQLANNAQVPPYAIFPDKTLMEMASFFPLSSTSLLDIHGVGSAKMSNYGPIFLKIISQYCRQHHIQERPKHPNSARKKTQSQSKRHILTGKAYNAGQSINKIQKDLNIKQSTVLAHLLKYVQEGYKIKADGLLPLSKISADQQEKVLDKFNSLGTDYLRPVYEALDEEISYDELHVLRLVYLSKNQS